MMLMLTTNIVQGELKARVNKLFLLADTDHSGGIDPDEFLFIYNELEWESRTSAGGLAMG